MSVLNRYNERREDGSASLHKAEVLRWGLYGVSFLGVLFF